MHHLFHYFRIFILYTVPTIFFNFYYSKRAYPFESRFPPLWWVISITLSLAILVWFSGVSCQSWGIAIPGPAWCYQLACHLCSLRLPILLDTSSMSTNWKGIMGLKPYIIIIIIIRDIHTLACLLLWTKKGNEIKTCNPILLVIHTFKDGYMHRIIHPFY